MKSFHQIVGLDKKTGFSLPMVLLAVSLIMFLVVSGMMLIMPARSSSNAYRQSYDFSLAEKTATEDALGTLSAVTSRDHFLTHQVNVQGAKYYVISWFDKDEASWRHQPLVSGVEAESTGMDGRIDGYTPFSDSIPLGDSSILMGNLGWDESQEERITARVPRVSLGDGFSYSYWVEDLNGNLDYEAVAFQDDSQSDRFDQYLTDEEKVRWNEEKIYSQRHIGLNVLSDGRDGEFEAAVDFTDPFASRSEKGGVIQHPLSSVLKRGLPSYLIDTNLVSKVVSEDYGVIDKLLNCGLADTVVSEVVPYGLNYPNAGSLKLNLNEVVAEPSTLESVDKVAQQIKNIPGFKDSVEEYREVGISINPQNPINTRYGGFPAQTESYCRTIAANIIDYADTDSSVSVSRSESGGNYRGVDAQPFYTEFLRRYTLSDATENGVVLQIRNFIELYNPSNQVVKGYLKTNFFPSSEHVITIAGVDYALPEEELYYWDGIITIEPNEYIVVELTVDENDDFIGDHKAYLHYELSGGSSGQEFASLTASRASSEGNRIEVQWYSTGGEFDTPEAKEDFSLVDGVVHGGFNVAKTSLIDTSDKNANNTLNGIPLYEAVTGDPRVTFYSQNQEIGALNYALRSSFGGPNNYQLEKDGKVAPESLFADRYYEAGHYGRDVKGCTSTPSRGMRYPGEFGYVKWDNQEGVKSQNLEEASGQSDSQYYVTQSEGHPQRYIQPLSNRGYFTSLGELGNIFDPAQWYKARRPTLVKDQFSEVDRDYFSEDFALNSDGVLLTAEELGEYGGGITLAIGSPEFHCFSTYNRGRGYESARLLDQFRVTDSPLRSLQGRVNLNTAPRPVLKALFTGFLHEKDTIIGSFVRQARNESEEVASALADGLIKARKERPFIALSDIALASAELDGVLLPVFGEKMRYNQQKQAEVWQDIWSDQGREELFRKLNDLFITQSRSYRIHLQIEQERGGVTTVSKKSFDITLHPSLTEDLTIDSTKPSQVKIHNKTQK